MGMEAMVLVDVGSDQLVAVYGTPEAVVWMPKILEPVYTTKEGNDPTVILGLTKRVSRGIKQFLCLK